MKEAASARARFKGILVLLGRAAGQPSTIITIPASSTVDSLETTVLDKRLVRVVSWYDNEWGFSNRMADTAALMGSMLAR